MILIPKQQLDKAIAQHLEKLEPRLIRKINRHPNTLPIYIKNFLKANLKVILNGKPKDLLEIHTLFYQTVNGANKNRFNKNLKTIFNYKYFTTKHERNYNAYDLAAQLDIRVCSYCNRQYTVTILTSKTKSGQVTRPQFDHFFSQKDFPLLALSFYNLIPSCVICNSTLKGPKKFNLEDNHHPYLEDIGTGFEMTYRLKSTKGGLGVSNDLSVKLNITTKNPDLKRKIVNANKIFRLDDIYSGHADEIADLIRLKSIFGSTYLNILANNTYKELKGKISENDLYLLAFGAYYESKEFHKRPMSKLKKDILRELGIV